MKKILVIVAFAISTTVSFSQGYNESDSNGDLGIGNFQVNGGLGFSNWGIPISIGVDYGIIENITIGAEMSYRTKSSYSAFGISINGNYHFNTLLELPPEFDVYGGVNLGYYNWDVGNAIKTPEYSSGLGYNAQIGGRYFFDDQLGLNLEFGGGNVSGGKLGVTYRF